MHEEAGALKCADYLPGFKDRESAWHRLDVDRHCLFDRSPSRPAFLDRKWLAVLAQAFEMAAQGVQRHGPRLLRVAPQVMISGIAGKTTW
jgi:hypothetical protein